MTRHDGGKVEQLGITVACYALSLDIGHSANAKTQTITTFTTGINIIGDHQRENPALLRTLIAGHKRIARINKMINICQIEIPIN